MTRNLTEYEATFIASLGLSLPGVVALTERLACFAPGGYAAEAMALLSPQQAAVAAVALCYGASIYKKEDFAKRRAIVALCGVPWPMRKHLLRVGFIESLWTNSLHAACAPGPAMYTWPPGPP